MIKAYIEIICELGTFKTDTLNLNELQYNELLSNLKDYYKGTFTSNTEDGYLVITPEILNKSVLRVRIIE